MLWQDLTVCSSAPNGFVSFSLNEVLDHLVYVSHCQKESRDSSVQAFRDQILTLIKEILVGLDCTDSKRKMSH
jgi:hypothetical protein